MSRDWFHLLRDLADALEQTERASDPSTGQLIVRARTLAYQERGRPLARVCRRRVVHTRSRPPSRRGQPTGGLGPSPAPACRV
jgi:hypothetical protein